MGINAITLIEFAKANGIHALGWTSGCEFTEYLKEIAKRPEYDFKYRSRERFVKVATPPAFAKTLLVLAVDYFIDTTPDNHDFLVANYARAMWSNIDKAQRCLVNFLKENGFRAEPVETPARAAAARAGLGFIGKNTLFYAHGLGSYVGIGTIGTDMELEPRQTGNGEKVASDRCTKCDICIKACPVGAIFKEGYRINPLKCISFLNRHPAEPEKDMPASIKDLKNWLYGCEICQSVCPINRTARYDGTQELESEIVLFGAKFPNKSNIEPALLESKLNEIEDADFQAYVKELLANAAKQ